MRRTLIAFFLIICILPLAEGQSIYSLQRDDSWQFKFSTSRKSDLYTNLILNQLALAHQKIPEKTTVTFFFNYGVSVGFQQGNLLDVSLSLTPSICTGDVEVRDFDLQNLLIPASCYFRIALIHPVKGEVFSLSRDQFPLSDLLAGSTIASFPDSLWSQGCRIDVGFRGFRFDELSFKRIERELFAIRDYDAAASMADTLEKRIRQARRRLHTPQEAFRTYVLCNKAVYLLDQAINTTTEIVPGNDPRGLRSKFPVIKYQFIDLVNFYISEGIAGPLSGNSYLNQAIGFGDALTDALKLSQRVDYYSSPIYYRLYANSISAGQLVEAAKSIGNFAESRGFHAVNFSMISERIVEEYIKRGKLLMQDGRFAEAVDILTSGIRFCDVNPTVVLPEKLISALDKARKGLTDSYIRIVRKALDNNLPALADKYLAEALQNATGNNNLNAADSAGFAGLYAVLTGKNIQAGNNYLNNKNFQEALSEFDKAYAVASRFELHESIVLAEDGLKKAVHGIYRKLFEKSEMALNDGNPELAAARLSEALEFTDGYAMYQPDPVTIDSLRRKIALVSYKALVQSAAEMVKVSDFENAVSVLLQASAISCDQSISHTALYDSIAVEAGNARAISLLSEGRLKLWAGEPEEALELAGEVMRLISMLGPGSKPEINVQYASLMVMADESLCSRVKGELNSLISRASENFSQNKFSEAARLVMAARELIYSRAGCGITTVELNKLTSKYQHPVNWNDMVKKATTLISNGDFLQGIEMIQQAGAVFNHYRLDTLGLVNTGLFELAMASEHLPLIRHATGHYITRDGYEQALKLLGRLRSLGELSEATVELQESLARVLADRDVAETSVVDLKAMLKAYTGGDKWYKRFASVYRYHIENR
ncbi:MAG: hypothetical protein V1775_10040 [Bacteroidota bacterium]